MDVAALREFAEKATGKPWAAAWPPWVAPLTFTAQEDLDFIAAVSPEVVLALCDVAEALERIANPPEVLHGYANELVRLARETLARLEELPVK